MKSQKEKNKKQERFMLALICVLCVAGMFCIGTPDSARRITADAVKTMAHLRLANQAVYGEDAEKQEIVQTILQEYEAAREAQDLNKVMQSVLELRSHVEQCGLSEEQILEGDVTYGAVSREVDRLQGRMSRL